MRVLANDVARHAGASIQIQGWLHKTRKMGGLTFINVRDRSGLVQVLVEDKSEVEKLRGLQIGTVLSIQGSVVKDDRAPGGAEIHDPKLTIDVPVTEVPPIEIDKPIDHKPENHDTLFDYRPVNIRNLTEQSIFRIRARLNKEIRRFMEQNDFVEMQTPKLLPGATEGGAEVFKLDYFGKEATLAQSPQFYKQIMVGAFERVYEIGQAYRAEPSATTRHVTELTMLDMEMGFIDEHDDVLKMTERLVYDVLTAVYKDELPLLNKLQAPPLKLLESFPRFTVAEIHEMYSKATGENTVGEKDLRPAEERWICEYAKKKHDCEAVFATNLPIESMKFYHMKNPDDPSSALSADLLFRGVEVATCPMREHRYEEVVKQMKDAGLNPEDPGFTAYLMAFRSGLPKHGGFGFGIDRFAYLTCGLQNIKEAMLFPRDINRLAP